MWGNVTCSLEGLFHRHCQLDISDFQLETGPWLEGISEQEQLSLPPPSLCPVVRAGPCSPQRLLNWMLALACQQGHLAVVKLLVLTYGADPESYAVRKNEFPVIVRLPLYAAIKSGGSRSGPKSLCAVETRACPSHSPSALQRPVWRFAALFLASSSKDLRPSSFP